MGLIDTYMEVISPEAKHHALIHVDREIDPERFRADVETHINRFIRETSKHNMTPIASISEARPSTKDEDKPEDDDSTIWLLNILKGAKAKGKGRKGMASAANQDAYEKGLSFHRKRPGHVAAMCPYQPAGGQNGKGKGKGKGAWQGEGKGGTVQKITAFLTLIGLQLPTALEK